MEFPFSRIFKQAYSLIRTKRSLWAFGLFLVWGNIFNFLSLFYPGPNSDQYDRPVNTTSFEMTFDSTSIPMIIIAACALLFIMSLFVLYFRSRAGIIISTKAFLDKKPVTFGVALKSARFFVWRIIGSWLVVNGGLVLSAAILASPVIYFSLNGMPERALSIGMLALGILVPIVFIVYFLNIFSVLFIVLHDLKIGEGIKAAFDLVSRFWWTVLSVSFVLIFLATVGFFAGLVVFGLIASPFVILANFPYYIGGYSLEIPIMSAGIVLGLGGFLWLQAILVSFQHVSWILVFLELVKPKKLDEKEEAAVVPEVV